MLFEPLRPRAGTQFSGWRIVALAAVAIGMSGPGQTAGVSVFVDPMIDGLGLTRSQVAGAYMVGTLGGALAMPRVGRLLDDHGPRLALAVIGGLFGVVLAAMAGVTGLVTLTLGFVGIRMFGQGALPLIATTAVAYWFERRRGVAIGITSAFGFALFSLVPLASTPVIGLVGWRYAWLVVAAAVWLVVLPIALRGLIDRPADVGQHVDGHVPTREEAAARRLSQPSFTRGQALRTPMFWAVTGAVATTGMIATGLNFHQINLLGERGLTPVQAAANFLPQIVAGVATTLLVGALIDRVASRWVLLASMAALAAAMAGVQLVRPGWTAITYGMLLGAAASAARAVEAASFPRLYGLGSLGAIRGVVTAVSVAATALGPAALSFGRDLTGSYVQVLLVLLVLPSAIAALGLVAPTPRPPPASR